MQIANRPILKPAPCIAAPAATKVNLCTQAAPPAHTGIKPEGTQIRGVDAALGRLQLDTAKTASALDKLTGANHAAEDDPLPRFGPMPSSSIDAELLPSDTGAGQPPHPSIANLADDSDNSQTVKSEGSDNSGPNGQDVSQDTSVTTKDGTYTEHSESTTDENGNTTETEHIEFRSSDGTVQTSDSTTTFDKDGDVTGSTHSESTAGGSGETSAAAGVGAGAQPGPTNGSVAEGESSSSPSTGGWSGMTAHANGGAKSSGPLKPHGNDPQPGIEPPPLDDTPDTPQVHNAPAGAARPGSGSDPHLANPVPDGEPAAAEAKVQPPPNNLADPVAAESFSGPQVHQVNLQDGMGTVRGAVDPANPNT
jgi:hypothetical protein